MDRKEDHRKSLTVVQVKHRLVYKSVKWWLDFGGRSKDELSCIHDIKLNMHCQTCVENTNYE